MQAVILGAGASGVLHALALRAAGVRIAAVYDPERERAQALADACGGRVVETLATAAAVDAEIAAICSPPNEHVAQAERMCAARADRVVFVEKPIATTTTELERIAALSRCVPILQWRAGRALHALRRVLSAGELGAAPVIACDLVWSRDDAYLDARRGWGVGALLSIGIHALDALSWALERDIVAVAGLTSMRAWTGCRTETSAVAVLRFDGGATAALRISLDGGGETTTLTLCGGGRTVSLAGGEADPTGGHLAWRGRSDADTARLAALEQGADGALGSPLLVPYVGAAVAALRDGEVPGSSVRLPAVESTIAAHAAAMQLARHEGTATMHR